MPSKIKNNGDDVIVGTTGTDFLQGGNGNDLISSYDLTMGNSYPVRTAFNDKTDFVYGGNGNDTIDAGGGGDFLSGDNGDDRLIGNYGNDLLLGGRGADIFQFSVQYASPGAPSFSGGVGAGNRDIIGDFQQGTDHIDLSGYQNLYYSTPGIDFVGEGGVAAMQKTQAGFHYEGANTVIDIAFTPSYIAPGQTFEYRGPVAQIEIAGHVALTASDFILA